jgi:DNA replicative helicase MCM subunit Mcm2 (Cdc46/Mcm family)
MTLLKKGVSFGPMIVSNMVFVCEKCNHVDIVSDKDYVPDMERKCPKCQEKMTLKLTETSTMRFKARSIEGPTDLPSNRGGDAFDNPTQE